MRIAFVVVKLKVFKVLRTDSATMKWSFLSPYSHKYGQILPKFSPEVLLWQIKKLFKKYLSFHGKETDPKFALLVQL